MLSGKKDFLLQINSVVKQRWAKECADIFGRLISEEVIKNSDDFHRKNYLHPNSGSIALDKLKERVQSLEEVRDQLSFLLSFFIENLPELITKTIQSDIQSGSISSHIKNTSVNQPGYTEDFRSPESYPLPTRREKDILDLLEKGYCAKEIASRLFISETTVITHKKNLKKKYNVKNTVELISKVRKERNY